MARKTRQQKAGRMKAQRMWEVLRARKRGEEVPSRQAVKESTAATVGPDGTSSQVLTEAPFIQELADDASPEPLPCQDVDINQENTVPPNTIEPLEGWCRCCLVPISCKGEQFGKKGGELTDTYADMLLNTFGITVTQVQGLSVINPALICSICKVCLQNAFAFKQQILEADARFVEKIGSELFNALTKNHEPAVTNRSTAVEGNSRGSENIKEINDHNNSNYKHTFPDSKKVTAPGPTSRKEKNKGPGIKCELCHKVEDNCIMMSYHVKRYHHRCLKCSKMFRNKYERDDHELTHPLPCELCEEEFETDLLLRSHMVRVHETTIFHTCPKCKKIFDSRAKFNEHRVEAHGVSQLKCGACDKMFYDKTQLSSHHRVQHMLERNFPCPKCDYKAANRNHLQYHMVRHSDVKSFQCQYCQKKFARPRTLLYHERIHTGDKRQVCQLCGAAFVQRASLKYHLEKQHPGQY